MNKKSRLLTLRPRLADGVRSDVLKKFAMTQF